MQAFHHVKVFFGNSLELLFASSIIQALWLHTCGTDFNLSCSRDRCSLAMRYFKQIFDELGVIFADFVLSLY